MDPTLKGVKLRKTKRQNEKRTGIKQHKIEVVEKKSMDNKWLMMALIYPITQLKS